MIGTCKDCPDRYPACHDTCPKYQESLKEHLEIRTRRRKENMGNAELTRMYAEKKAKRMRRFGEDMW